MKPKNDQYGNGTRQTAGTLIDDSSAGRARTGFVKAGSLQARSVNIMLNLTREELTLLAALASDQLFRKEFIDPKMPGHKTNLEEIRLGKALVGRMRAVLYGPTPHNTKPPHPAK